MFNFSKQLNEIKSSIIGLVMLVATAIIGLIWISIALYSFLSTTLGPVWGPLSLGGLCLLPLLIFILSQALNKKDARSAEAIHTDTAIHSISKIIEVLSARSPFLASIAAIIAGFMATRFPSLLLIFTQIISAYAEDIKRREPRPDPDKN